MSALSRFSGRVLQWTGGALTAAAVLALAALRAAASSNGGPDVLAALGQSVLVASYAMLLTLVAAVGLGLLVAGSALAWDEKATRAAPARTLGRRARADEE